MKLLQKCAATLAAVSTLAASTTAQEVETLDAQCRALAEKDFAGVILIERAGEILFHEAYGTNAGDDSTSVTIESLFYIGSVAKVITTTTALRLETRGDVSLDEPISTYLDEVPEDKRAITLRHLLTHTSGLPANHPDPARAIGRDDFVKWCLGAALEFKPGEDWAYSNVGYSLAAAVLERTANTAFTELVRDLVFDPAEMEHARFVDELAETDGPIAIGSGELATKHGLDGNPRSYGNSWLRIGPGGIVLTAADLLAIDRALRTGKLLSKEQVDKTTTPIRDGWGMGWRLSRTRHEDPLLFHDGGFPGFSAGYARIPSDNACLIILCNREAGLEAVQRQAMDLLMKAD